MIKILQQGSDYIITITNPSEEENKIISDTYGLIRKQLCSNNPSPVYYRVTVFDNIDRKVIVDQETTTESDAIRLADFYYYNSQQRYSVNYNVNNKPTLRPDEYIGGLDVIVDYNRVKREQQSRTNSQKFSNLSEEEYDAKIAELFSDEPDFDNIMSKGVL